MYKHFIFQYQKMPSYDIQWCYLFEYNGTARLKNSVQTKDVLVVEFETWEYL